MEIVKVRPEHIPQIAETEKESFSDPWTEENIRSESALPQKICLAAEEGGIVCGYIFGSADNEYAGIDKLAVSPSFRRRGVGMRLLSAFREYAEMSVYSNAMSLEVRESNSAAIGLYKKFGFVDKFVRRDFYSNPRENAVIMIYSLS